MQSTEPDSSRRHSGVVDVSQFWQTGCVKMELWSVNDAAMVAMQTVKLGVSTINDSDKDSHGHDKI